MPPLSRTIAQPIAEHITEITGQFFQIERQQAIGGGCINQAVAVSGGVGGASPQETRTFFVKLNQADRLAMFEAERDGLKEMYDSQTIRVPQPLGCGTVGDTAYIILEWLSLGGRGSNASWQKMGERLAAMHNVNSAKGFGWHRDNTIGATPQLNGWCGSWVEFWRDRRLGPQFEMAHDKGAHFPRRDELMSAVPRLLANHAPSPSLLHGDLWSGNSAITSDGEPVIVDPATYYGDGETDLAMTELFGRLPSSFYQAYQSVRPLNAGYEQRKTLYNLYHILNHYNLFGGGYLDQSNSTIDQIL